VYDSHEKKGKILAISTWRQLGDALSPKNGGKIATWSQDVGFITLASSYLILCESLMSHALPFVPLTQSTWTCCAVAIVLPTVFLKSYSQIAWLSTVSVVAISLTVATTMWYGLDHINRWDASTLMFWDMEGVFISLSIILYSYGAVPIVPSVEQSMRNKSKFVTALASAELMTMPMNLMTSSQLAC